MLTCSKYITPEHAMHRKFSVKSDVFCFGVLILEIVSGKNNCFQNRENEEDLLCYVSTIILGYIIIIKEIYVLYCVCPSKSYIVGVDKLESGDCFIL